MVTINAWWDEDVDGNHYLCLDSEDSQGNDCPEELEGRWIREGLPALKQKAEALDLKVWIGEEDRFV